MLSWLEFQSRPPAWGCQQSRRRRVRSQSSGLRPRERVWLLDWITRLKCGRWPWRSEQRMTDVDLCTLVPQILPEEFSRSLGRTRLESRPRARSEASRMNMHNTASPTEAAFRALDPQRPETNLKPGAPPGHLEIKSKSSSARV